MKKYKTISNGSQKSHILQYIGKNFKPVFNNENPYLDAQGVMVDEVEHMTENTKVPYGKIVRQVEDKRHQLLNYATVVKEGDQMAIYASPIKKEMFPIYPEHIRQVPSIIKGLGKGSGQADYLTMQTYIHIIPTLAALNNLKVQIEQMKRDSKTNSNVLEDMKTELTNAQSLLYNLTGLAMESNTAIPCFDVDSTNFYQILPPYLEDDFRIFMENFKRERSV